MRIHLALFMIVLLSACSTTKNQATWLLVESFPNNHAFGLSNLRPEEIEKEAYDHIYISKGVILTKPPNQ